MNASAIRLALRVEGDFWCAYVASPGTMDGAFLIGSIAMGIVQKPSRKRAFMDLMQDALKDHLKALGATVTGFETTNAPEHERSGRAE